jgi:hypothetical protein
MHVLRAAFLRDDQYPLGIPNNGSCREGQAPGLSFALD